MHNLFAKMLVATRWQTVAHFWILVNSNVYFGKSVINIEDWMFEINENKDLLHARTESFVVKDPGCSLKSC